jgi:hypothetical protein
MRQRELPPSSSSAVHNSTADESAKANKTG